MKRVIDRGRTYLLISITASCAAGVFSSSLLLLNDSLLLILLSITTVISFILWLTRKQTIPFLLICCSFFILGHLLAADQRLTESTWNDNASLFKDEREVLLVGTFTKFLADNNRLSKALFHYHHAGLPSQNELIAVSGTALLTMNGPWPAFILPGENAVVRIRLSQSSGFNTPGTFNYQRYLSRQKIAITGFVQSPLFISAIDNKLSEKTDTPHSWSLQIERTRALISRFLSKSLEEEASGLYKALLLGDKSSLNNETLDTFKSAGVMHILAVSGMHLALLSVLFFTLIYWLLRRSTLLMLRSNVKKIAMLLCLPPLGCYAVLAGSHPPVLRSLLMIVIAVTALCFNRPRSPFTLLAAAGLFLMMADPLIIETASFQLSFFAVASIIYIAVPFHSTLKERVSRDRFPEACLFFCRPARWLCTAIAVTAAATLGTAPLLITHFNHISLVGIPANLIVEPLICLWSLPLGFSGIIALFFFPETAEILFNSGAIALEWALAAADFFASLPLASLWLPAPALWLSLIYYGALFLAFSTSARVSYRIGAGFVILGCTLLALQPLIGIPTYRKQSNSVTFIDTGHGSASLIQLKNGQSILIDGGGKSSPSFDIGERVIAPFLWDRGIARLDHIVITHDDADHYNGIPSLIKRFQPGNLWVPYLNDQNRPFSELCRTAEQNGVSLHVADTNLITTNSEETLSVIDHFPLAMSRQTATGDDHGLIVRLETAHFSILFPGDISSSKEQELVADKVHLPADILLSPHHGSATSNSYIFLETVNPRLMVVSNGSSRSNLFPARQTRDNAQELGIRILTTADDGTISITETAEGFRVETFKNRWSLRMQSPNEQHTHTSVKSLGGFRRYFKNFDFSIELE